LKISVIICTHNPRVAYLRRTIESLQKQSLPTNEWELLLIDNASSTRLSDEWELSWHPRARHVRENAIGLTPARLRGVREARAPLLLYVDDDNDLSSDYLENALLLADEDPELSVWGAGVLEPEFEVQPAVKVRPYLYLLALRTVSEPSTACQLAGARCIPWGAGLVVRRTIAMEYTTLMSKLSAAGEVIDRTGSTLFCGGDDLFSWVAVQSGCKFGIFPQLRITHLISKGRVEPNYLLRLLHDNTFSHKVLRFLVLGEVPKQPSLFTKARAVLSGIKHGFFRMQASLAVARGSLGALEFISSRSLRPLEQVAGRSEP
jgi:glycosyltransferase involved in cell wall biosynthesis